MGVEIKFTGKDLPVSPGFIEFRHHRIGSQAVGTSWHDQVTETRVPAEFEKRVRLTRHMPPPTLAVAAHPEREEKK